MNARVLIVSSEAVPLIKTGGLADVITSLARAVRMRGIDATVMMPGYPAAIERAKGLQEVALPSGLKGGPGRLLHGVIPDGDVPVLLLSTQGFEVPDLYQGTEFWDFSLVDPDNRSPVDYASRIQAMEQGASRKADIEDWRSGRLKQQIIFHALQLRANESDLFARGEYLPLEMDGPAAANVIGFMRRIQNRAAIVLVSHLVARMLGNDGKPVVPADAWQATAVLLPEHPDSTWRDIFTGTGIRLAGGRIAVSDALATLPVAVLTMA